MSGIRQIDPARWANLPHGTRGRYKAARCRCFACRLANAAYANQRYHARKAGDFRELVDAGAVREHLLRLRAEGVGVRSIAAAADINTATVRDLERGLQTQLRRHTAERILKVDAGAKAGGALVPAGETWKRIHRLIRNGGFSKAEIARRLGKSSPALQIRHKQIRLTTAVTIERFYRAYMGEVA